jgi:hypothetical protein
MRGIAFGAMAVMLLLALSLGAWGQCASEVEDNDTAALADFVAELPGSGCISGSIGIVGDIDFYYFDVASARSVVIETVTTEDTEVALWDANGNPIAQNDDVALNVYSSRIESYLEAGRYVVAVWEHGDDNVIYNYTLSIHAQGCASEVEQNNTFAMADYLGVLPGQVCIAGTIGVVGDFDVFAFDVTDWTVLTITTVTNEDTEISLLNADGIVLASNDDYIVGEYWSWIEQEVSPGGYYVMVWEHGDDNVIYDYTLTVTGSSCISEIESNDDATLADFLGDLPGQLCSNGSIDEPGDLDYYRFTVSMATDVSISTSTTGDTEIALFDSVGNTLAVNDDVSVGDTSSRIELALAAGTYYVAVREFTGADWIDAYTLYVGGS